MTQTIAVLSVLLLGTLATIAYLISKLRSAHRELNALHLSHRQVETDKIRAESELSALRASVEQERKRNEDVNSQLQNAFKSLAAQALEGNSKQFFEMAKTTRELEKSELEQKEQSLRRLVEPLQEILNKYHQHVSEIEKARERSYVQLENEIKRVAETSHLLARETQALKDALKRPHVRGRWGELQLKNCIELAGMSEYADVTFQDNSTDGDGQRMIPDMTVRMPGGHVVVVDAKTPIDAFLNSLEAQTDETRMAEMLRHGRHVKEHVKKLSTRAYGEALAQSADFTIMFLPNESFLYAALEVEPDLMEFALQRKVLIATPPTLIGLLKVIRFGWNEEKLAENAQRISEAGTELHKRICDFVEGYMIIGKSLEKAKQEYDKGLARLNSRVLVQAKRLEKLGAKSNKQLPIGLDDEEQDETASNEVALTGRVISSPPEESAGL